MATDDELNISFRPTPNYAALAEAASGSRREAASLTQEDDWMQGVRVSSVGELRAALEQATGRVEKERKGMLIEVLM